MCQYREYNTTHSKLYVPNYILYNILSPPLINPPCPTQRVAQRVSLREAQFTPRKLETVCFLHEVYSTDSAHIHAVLCALSVHLYSEYTVLLFTWKINDLTVQYRNKIYK